MVADRRPCGEEGPVVCSIESATLAQSAPISDECLMNRFPSLIRPLVTLLMATLITLFPVAAGYAAASDETTNNAGFVSWLPSVGIVILGLILGLFPLLKMSFRRDRARPEQYQNELADADK